VAQYRATRAFFVWVLDLAKKRKRRRHHLDRRVAQLINSAPPVSGPDKLLTAKQMAEWFGCAESTLESWRRPNKRGEILGPPFIRQGRSIRYRHDWNLDWLETRAHGRGPR
jgi:hypothetical protein